MEKHTRTGAIVNGEITLPIDIIKHIQSFLSGKEAAQTTVLSKAWYSAWLTRPNLHFDQCDFGCSYGNLGDVKGFWEFVQKTMQRFEELNLKIESLRLLMIGKKYIGNGVDPDYYSRAKELIVKAMKMGAVDLYFESLYGYYACALPNEVLGSETLTRLSIVGCKIGQGGDGKVRCSRLKSLSLERVYLEGDIIWDIISSCPLIEELSLTKCWFLLESQNSDVVSNKFALSPFTEFRNRFALSPFTEFGKRSIDHGRIKLFEFRKLKCLSLNEVNIHPLIFWDFSSRFPCLKELTLSDFRDCDDNGIRISSRSLECITFSLEKLKANLDVPSIRKFKFRGRSLPSLTFEASSTNWESDISIHCPRFSTSYCLKLKKLLKSLSLSRISLSLTSWSVLKQNIVFQGLRKIALKNLAIESLTMEAPYSICYTLLECFFQNSRPKFVTLYVPLLNRRYGNNGFPENLPMRLVQRMQENFPTLYQKMSGPKELSMKDFEEVLAGWQPLALSTLLDASTTSENKPKICFQLIW